MHFYSVIPKEMYTQIGGFDEEFAKGIACEDCDFVNNIAERNIPIVFHDDIYTIHVSHDVSYQKNIELVLLNWYYYKTKWNIEAVEMDPTVCLSKKVTGVY